MSNKTVSYSDLLSKLDTAYPCKRCHCPVQRKQNGTCMCESWRNWFISAWKSIIIVAKSSESVRLQNN